MPEQTHIIPLRLRQAAAEHTHTAEYLRSVPDSHPAIQESLDSLGPIFAEFAGAASDLLERRRRCYQRQADAHTELAEDLTTVADLWNHHEATAARRFRTLGDPGDVGP
ncbi:ESX-1 secretion-associated protein [Mycolicibacillus parakoreensis]|uniref:ESX-1 secretion-associated protein n=1 Tax=Mycolicibacillus parakoreensis TaxID=1069221 RepID=A0ABY3U5W9_9MYCO|nr:ESX-1 secretion-associated protein [Mycolicibacillus parakoreensis]MCV7314184.1 ESX-1 secretion-associated protein [Mycolicibacillus parakoreensis]ULN52902.1 ESX-1 secretion-associated protein [Mycolicibacillus parakoreensis]HLR98748.1 ESX-1 secretion-associated protein [Mycolicibacillus parakoreensis]